VRVAVAAQTEVAGRIEWRAALRARRPAGLDNGQGPTRECERGRRHQLHSHHVEVLVHVRSEERAERILRGQLGVMEHGRDRLVLARLRLVVLVFVGLDSLLAAFVRVVGIVHLHILVAQLACLDHHPASVAVPAQREQANAELLDDRLLEARRESRLLVADVDPALAECQQERCQALGEDSDLGLLKRDRHDLAALGGLKEKGSLTRLAHGATDEPVGLVEGVYAARHSDLQLAREGVDSNTLSVPAPPCTWRLFGLQFRTVSTLAGEQLDAVIVPVFKEGDAASATPDDLRQQVEWVARESGPRKLYSATTHLQEDSAGGPTRLVVVAAGKRDDYDIQRAWQAVSSGVRSLWQSTAQRIAIVIETEALDKGEAVQSAVEGVIFSMWRPETYRTGEDERQLPPLEEVLIVAGEDSGAGIGETPIKRGTFVGDAVNWARYLANEPANLMTPTRVAEEAVALASGTGLDIDVIEEDGAAALGMFSYLSVAHGSDEPAKFIVLRYHGRGGEGYDLGLVGKGITFDSGGISIKPSEDMHLMKHDMTGAAVVLASAGVVAQLGLPINLICVAPCTENLPGGHATKPGDVFTSMSGKTVEVINTDAEGRLVLIDGVTFVQREGAKRVVDVATLTGAIRIALGRYYTGLFGRPGSFVDAVRQAGDDSGERLWPMPLADEHRDEVKSDVADLRNSAGRLGGSILGAAFIDAAVDPDTEWAHLDIASTAWSEEDRTFSPKGPQAPMIRTIVELAAKIASRN